MPTALHDILPYVLLDKGFTCLGFMRELCKLQGVSLCMREITHHAAAQVVANAYGSWGCTDDVAPLGRSVVGGDTTTWARLRGALYSANREVKPVHTWISYEGEQQVFAGFSFEQLDLAGAFAARMNSSLASPTSLNITHLAKSCLVLAAKCVGEFGPLEGDATKLMEAVSLPRGAYLHWERLILKTIEWRVNMVTPGRALDVLVDALGSRDDMELLKQAQIRLFLVLVYGGAYVTSGQEDLDSSPVLLAMAALHLASLRLERPMVATWVQDAIIRIPQEQFWPAFKRVVRRVNSSLPPREA